MGFSKLIEQNKIHEQKEFSYEGVLNECIVDLDKDVKPLETLVYIGNDDRGNKCSVITKGEYFCIVAQAKTKKSFCKSLIIASYIGGYTNKYTEHITGSRKGKGYIIDIDTEQGKYYAKKTFSRVEKLVGHRYENYLPIQLRSKSVEERIGLIEWIIYESQYSGNIDMIFIDGVADLVYNTNCIEEGTKLAEKMLKWTSTGISIGTIIHKAGNNDKARGHLGTAITIKAESIIFMDRLMDEQGNITEKNTVKVRCGYSRGMSFEDFYLTVNREGLPFTHTEPENNIFQDDYIEEKQTPTASLEEAFGNDEDDKEIPF